MKPIIKGPFYGAATGALLGGIFCGPRVNHNLEVVDKEGAPIPGLYAAGLSAGGTNGEGVINATSLSNLGLAFATGWIAGDNLTSRSPYQPTGIGTEVGHERDAAGLLGQQALSQDRGHTHEGRVLGRQQEIVEEVTCSGCPG